MKLKKILTVNNNGIVSIKSSIFLRESSLSSLDESAGGQQAEYLAGPRHRESAPTALESGSLTRGVAREESRREMLHTLLYTSL